MVSERRRKRMRAVLARRQLDLEVVLDNVHDAHNASAVVRTADGFGVGSVGLLYTDEAFPDVSAGVSGYARKWTTFHEYGSAAACVAACRARGMRVVATHLGRGARSYLDVDWTQPTAVAFGNEHRGCTPELIDAADATIRIPMQGMAESFNVSVAAAIVLAEAHRQRLAAGLYAPAWNDAKEAVWREWLAREAFPHRLGDAP